MEQIKNLCVQVPLALHAKIREEQERTGQTLSQYMVELLTQHYENQNGGQTMKENTRTLAFQVPEDFFQRIKNYLAQETVRTGKKLTQRDFILGVVEEALQKAEQQAQNAPQATGTLEQTQEPPQAADDTPEQADGQDEPEEDKMIA